MSFFCSFCRHENSRKGKAKKPFHRLKTLLIPPKMLKVTSLETWLRQALPRFFNLRNKFLVILRSLQLVLIQRLLKVIIFLLRVKKMAVFLIFFFTIDWVFLLVYITDTVESRLNQHLSKKTFFITNSKWQMTGFSFPFH